MIGNKPRRMRRVEHVKTMGVGWRNAYRVSVWRYAGRRLIGRPRCMWENNVKTGLI